MSLLFITTVLISAPLEAHVPADVLLVADAPSKEAVGYWLGGGKHDVALASLLVPPKVHKDLAGATRVVVAFLRSPAGDALEPAAWVEAPLDADKLLTLMRRWLEAEGFTAVGEPAPEAGARRLTMARGSPSEEIAVVASVGRAGFVPKRLGSEPGGALAPRSPALESVPAWKTLTAEAAAATRLYLDVPRFYGFLARTSQGRLLAGIIDRLGLIDAKALTVRLAPEVVSKRAGLLASFRLAVPPPKKGLLEALAPAAPALLPPVKGLSTSRALIRPAQLLTTARLVMGYVSPLETALFETQLSTFDQRAGVRLDAILGEAPQRLVAYELEDGSGVVELNLADAAGAARWCDALAQGLPQLAPGTTGQKTKLAGKPAWLLGEVVVALDGARLVIGTSKAVVTTQLEARPNDKPHGGEPVSALGVGQKGATLEPLLSALGKRKHNAWSLLAERAQAAGVSRATLSEALTVERWSVAVGDEGARGELLLRR